MQTGARLSDNRFPFTFFKGMNHVKRIALMCARSCSCIFPAEFSCGWNRSGIYGLGRNSL